MSAASGMLVADRVKTLYDKMKVASNKEERIRLIVFSIKDNMIDVHEDKIYKQCDLDCSKIDCFDQFKNHLCAKQSLYLLYDCHFEKKELGTQEDLVFAMWNGPETSIKNRMTYCSSVSAIKKCFPGIKHDIEMTDFDEAATRANFMEKLNVTDVTSVEGKPLRGCM
ncbi:cofilin-1-like [Corythoichthys intestinalis]|uniref:cofilin-1-like n=1 Tax=Corythoichthys intestinalis TaxID=161448 RepID=UPI0025A67E23|nr:cofilin-1-like [Corythoichthys intestinalis]